MTCSCCGDSLQHVRRFAVALVRQGSSWLCLALPCDTLPVCGGEGGADVWHDSLDGNTCWDECLQVSTGICDAQPVWNWEPLQRCVGGNLSNQKADSTQFAVVEVVAKSLLLRQMREMGAFLYKCLKAARTQVAASSFQAA